MKCSIDGCPGEYETGKIMHTVRHHGHVPAGICSVCGDVLLRPDTVRRIRDPASREASTSKHVASV